MSASLSGRCDSDPITVPALTHLIGVRSQAPHTDRPNPRLHVTGRVRWAPVRSPDRADAGDRERRLRRPSHRGRKEGPMAETYNGYCVKCKEKRDFEGEVAETNGRRMAKGTCPVCGTKMNRILGKA